MGHLCGKDDFIVQGIEICLAEMLRATSYERRATSYRGASWMHFQDDLSRSILDALPGRATSYRGASWMHFQDELRTAINDLRATNYELQTTLCTLLSPELQSPTANRH
jgi:hypothetical protein